MGADICTPEKVGIILLSEKFLNGAKRRDTSGGNSLIRLFAGNNATRFVISQQRLLSIKLN